MTAEIIRISNNASSKELCSLLERDGAVIVEDLLSQKQITSINADLDPHIKKAGPGLRNPTAKDMIDF